MAHVVQTETALFQWLPLATTPHGRLRRPGEPFAWGVHTQDALAIDDIGVGDTGGFILELPLRKNFAYRLVQAAVQVRDADGGIAQWLRGSMRMYWHPQPSINPALTTEITYPMAFYQIQSAELLYSNHWTLGGGVDAGLNAASGNNDPGDMPLVYGTDGILNQFMMLNANQSQDNYNISYQFRWLAYSIEDSLTTAIYWPMPVIGV